MNKTYLKMLRTPLYMLYEITYQCNNRCLFCYNEDNNCNHENYNCIPKEKFMNLLAHKPFMIVFTGGEPLLSENLFEYAELCKMNNIKTSMITNGTMVDMTNIDKITKLFDDIQVSMQGYNAELHDSITQSPGSFKHAINGIKLLVKSKLNLNINLTLTKLNKDYIPQIVESLSAIGVKNLSITRFCNSRSKYSAELELKKTEFLNTVELIEKECMKHGITFCGIYSGVPLCIFDKKVNYSIRGCSCGHSWVTITPDGGIKPCPGYDRIVGSITQLEKDWNDGLLKKWRDLRFLPKYCADCSMLNACKGGCRTAAYNCFGSIDSLDPLLVD